MKIEDARGVYECVGEGDEGYNGLEGSEADQEKAEFFDVRIWWIFQATTVIYLVGGTDEKL